MYRSNHSKNSRGGGSRAILTVLLLVLAVAVIALVLILLDKRACSRGGAGTGTNDPENTSAARPVGETNSALVISEVRRGDDGYIELLNVSGSPVDLSSYCLSDNIDKLDKWRFPQHQLAAGGYAVALLRGSAFTGEALEGEQLADGTVCPVFNAAFKLNSEENCAYLSLRGGAVADRLEFNAEMPDAVCAIRTGSNIAYTGIPTPGRENSAKIFTEFGWKEMDQSDPVRINEVLPSNKFDAVDKYGDRSDWVELYNSSSESVELLGYYLSDSLTEPGKWALPDVTLEPGAYIVIFLSGRDVSDGDEFHTSFKLSTADDGLHLINFNGMRRDTITVPENLSQNVSIGRGEDGSLLYFAKPTPGERNSTAGFADHIGVGGFDPSSCYISEVCAVTAARSGENDWVELFNASGETLSLDGWHLSDSLKDLQKYDLTGTSLPAGGYVVIECSKDGGAGAAAFSLSQSGDSLYLTNAEGAVVDYFETGALRTGVTSGRESGTSDGARVFFISPTRGAKNPDTCLLEYAAAPVFSDVELYRTAPFSLELTAKNADGTIHYTLDGSKPTTSSPVYSSPIQIGENTVVRAMTSVPGKLESECVAATYLFEEKHSLPVVTLALAPSDFSEVYAVSKPFVPVVEREAHMQFFEKDGTLGVESPAGIRVSGASTRAYAQKSLGVYFRGGYGRSSITYPFFGSDYFTNFGSIVLRNAGQDWTGSRIRDSFASTAVLDMNIDASASRFVAVYVNGRYWGLYDLKENMNEDYLVTHYGVEESSANIIKRNTMELEGTNEDFLRVRSYVVQNDKVIPLTDERYEEFTKWVDAESIADYLIARQYFPDADMFNQKYWRTNDYTVRWRAIFFDSDFALSSARGDVLHLYFDVKGVPSANGSLSQMDLYCGLESNEKWRHDFLVRYIYVTKYYLNNERLLPLFDSMVAEMDSEIPRQIARWKQPSSYSHWQTKTAELRRMIEERPEYSKQNLMYVMKLSASQYAALEAEADAIHASNGGVFK